MKGWEAIKALIEGKRITTKNGLMGAEYLTIKDNTYLVRIDKEGKEYDRTDNIEIQSLFDNDWRLYDERIIKQNEYRQLIKEVREKNKGDK